MNNNRYNYDFAISYAGEDKKYANKIYNSLLQISQDFKIFYSPKEQVALIGQDGENFFERLFKEAKQVIVIISKSYKKKIWTRYEWDIILERELENRFIPIRLDKVKILGLPFSLLK